MRKLLTIIVTLFGVSTSVMAQDVPIIADGDHVQEYIKIINEVPLMDGLYEVKDSELIFDKPDGRIAEIIYFSDFLSKEDLDSYYNETLPQLGWLKSDTSSEEVLTFIREQESLTVMASKSEGELVVKFNIFPYENTSDK